MSIINKLATTLKRRDEAPNIELAKQISARNDKKAVQELIDNLSNKSKDIQHDCIKLLYEIGERKPALIAPYIKDLMELFKTKNNRLHWGAMHALDAITMEEPKKIYALLPRIITAAESGSVITKDHAVGILIKLCSFKQYEESAFTLLIEQLQNSLPNQLPMYAENTVPIVNEKNKMIFMKTLVSRLGDIEKETKRKRVEIIIRKISGKK